MFLLPDRDPSARKPILAIARTLVSDRPFDLVLVARSAPGKRLRLRTPEGTPLGTLARPGDRVAVALPEPGGPASRTALVFMGHEPTFGFDLKFGFLEGTLRCQIRVLGAVDGRFRITRETWSGDLARRGMLRIEPGPGGPLLSFRFDPPP
jgi:hypothetical protein